MEEHVSDWDVRRGVNCWVLVGLTGAASNAVGMLDSETLSRMKWR